MRPLCLDIGDYRVATWIGNCVGMIIEFVKVHREEWALEALYAGVDAETFLGVQSACELMKLKGVHRCRLLHSLMLGA